MSFLLYLHILNKYIKLCDNSDVMHQRVLSEYNQSWTSSPQFYEIIISKRQKDYFVDRDILLTFTCGHFVDRK